MRDRKFVRYKTRRYSPYIRCNLPWFNSSTPLGSFACSYLHTFHIFERFVMSNPINRFFSERYPEYDYRESQRDWRQIGAFNGLAIELQWSQRFRAERWEAFKSTWIELIEEEFSGTDLYDYQELCRDLDLTPATTIEGCREEIEKLYVNIVDLVQYRRDRRRGVSPQRIPQFGSYEELKQYSKEAKKWLPIQTANTEMLKALFKMLH